MHVLFTVINFFLLEFSLMMVYTCSASSYKVYIKELGMYVYSVYSILLYVFCMLPVTLLLMAKLMCCQWWYVGLRIRCSHLKLYILYSSYIFSESILFSEVKTVSRRSKFYSVSFDCNNFSDLWLHILCFVWLQWFIQIN